jgi:hypothetical protein
MRLQCAKTPFFFTIESSNFFTFDNALVLSQFIAPFAIFALAEVPVLILGDRQASRAVVHRHPGNGLRPQGAVAALRSRLLGSGSRVMGGGNTDGQAPLLLLAAQGFLKMMSQLKPLRFGSR